MTLVVYNACYGGFSLSRQAILLAREISANPQWGGACIIGDVDEWGRTQEADYGFCHNIPRHDPVLVAVVQKLGEAANGKCASLAVHDIGNAKQYRIEEYDGAESVVTPKDIEWVSVE